MISMFLHETFRTGLIFLSRSKWVQTVVCYDQNLQKHKYLSTISIFLRETFRTGLIFLSRSKWVQTVVCYSQNLQKHKYLSTISIFLHKTFRTGLIFLSRLKWVQTVVCYDQNLQKHKYFSMISIFLIIYHYTLSAPSYGNNINRFSLLAQLISCAITNHYLCHDCHCQHQHQHCRQKLTSRSVPI